MAFASVLQNNPTDELLSYVDRWRRGEQPTETGFEVETREARRQCNNYSPVVELWGILNLHNQPFYNGAVPAYKAFGEPTDPSPISGMIRVGKLTHAALAAQPALVERLSGEFDAILKACPAWERITFEGKNGSDATSAEARERQDIGIRIAAEIARGAEERARQCSPQQRAAIVLHTLLDASIYNTQPDEDSKLALAVGGAESPAQVQRPEGPTYRQDAHGYQQDRFLDLPPSLLEHGNDALAYLHAGFHVLLAGAPGTGKTTLAQFVGHAWNQNLSEVVTRINLAEAPITTVASSAWAPFHTIGGIMPGEGGAFTVQKGIFVDPADRPGGAWQLRGQSIVLDEMNRADLDRCVGELYPLLTHNVSYVAPAGIPGVGRIYDHPRFRLISTVNDATIDDIVFPISEGLARR